MNSSKSNPLTSRCDPGETPSGVWVRNERKLKVNTMTTLRVLTIDCRLIEVQTCNEAMTRELLPEWYVEASDRVMVPSCDLAQYERGERPIRETVTM